MYLPRSLPATRPRSHRQGHARSWSPFRASQELRQGQPTTPDRDPRARAQRRWNTCRRLKGWKGCAGGAAEAQGRAPGRAGRSRLDTHTFIHIRIRRKAQGCQGPSFFADALLPVDG
ncbi:hypothetical protein IG631_17523 [Alternaria alternata]|nr:hypothetical protein IG631_17523 [Alternaria alternata]